jgi:hypothetical protein
MILLYNQHMVLTHCSALCLPASVHAVIYKHPLTSEMGADGGEKNTSAEGEELRLGGNAFFRAINMNIHLVEIFHEFYVHSLHRCL